MDLAQFLPPKGAEHPIYPNQAIATQEASVLLESEPQVQAVYICCPTQVAFASAPAGVRVAIFRAADMKPGDFLVIQRSVR